MHRRRVLMCLAMTPLAILAAVSWSIVADEAVDLSLSRKSGCQGSRQVSRDDPHAFRDG
ncbi:MAG: hypothetical protein U0744_21835 [Gemmataceae bacterium]